MCTVGDAQQSIYRFRGADVSVYRRHLEDVRRRNPEGIIELPDNFRSHGDVLALCDRIFEQPQVFGAEFMSLGTGARRNPRSSIRSCPDGASCAGAGDRDPVTRRVVMRTQRR